MEAVLAGAAAVVLKKAIFSPESCGTTEAEVDAALRKLNLSRLLKRLTHEDGLGTTHRSLGAIGEYKAFLKLVWLHPGENLMPSKAVDLVWQRHLLDTKVYAEECVALFGTHLHRVYDAVEAPGAALERTMRLYKTANGAVPDDVADLWKELATVPASTSVSADLPRPPQKPLLRALRTNAVSAVEDEDLEWLGVAVATELPLKQAVCKHSEPLRQIAIKDPVSQHKTRNRPLRRVTSRSSLTDRLLCHHVNVLLSSPRRWSSTRSSCA